MNTLSPLGIISLTISVLLVFCVTGCASPADVLSEKMRSEDSMVRWDTVEKLGELRSSDAVEPLIEALTDRAAEVRGAAIDALIKTGMDAVEPLVKVLSSGTTVAKVGALVALGEIGAPSSISAVRLLVNDKDAGVRAEAKTAMAKLMARKAKIKKPAAAETQTKKTPAPKPPVKKSK